MLAILLRGFTMVNVLVSGVDEADGGSFLQMSSNDAQPLYREMQQKRSFRHASVRAGVAGIRPHSSDFSVTRLTPANPSPSTLRRNASQPQAAYGLDGSRAPVGLYEVRASRPSLAKSRQRASQRPMAWDALNASRLGVPSYGPRASRPSVAAHEVHVAPSATASHGISPSQPSVAAYGLKRRSAPKRQITQKARKTNWGPLSHDYCESAFKDKQHIFHGMWSDAGILSMYHFALSNGANTQQCWEAMGMSKHEYLTAVHRKDVLGYGCARNWIAPEPPVLLREGASMIVGNDVDITFKCHPVGCPNLNFHMLYLLSTGMEHWNMCRNFEFIACGAMGALPNQTLGRILLATAPKDLWPDTITFEPQRAWRNGQEEYLGTNVILLHEVCLLDKLCSNREELYALGKGDYFHCQFDEQGFYELASLL